MDKNLRPKDMFDCLRSIAATLKTIAANIGDKIGDLADLLTTDKSTAVAAINEGVEKQGDLSELTTSDKTSLVAAINELAARVSALEGYHH